MKTKHLFLITCCLAAGPMVLAQNIFPSSGNVGIGTSSPDAPLEVSGSDTQLIIDAIGAGNDARIFLDAVNNVGSNYNTAAIIADAGSGGTTAILGFDIIDGDGMGWNRTLTIKASPGNLPYGFVGIGTINPTSLLTVNGKIEAEEIEVKNVGADYVFESDYNLLSLDEVEDFIRENGHLPGIAPASETEKGVELGQFSEKLLQKIEEMTLYMLEQQKRIQKLEDQIQKLTR